MARVVTKRITPRRLLVAAALLAALSGFVWAGSRIPSHLVGIHQRSTTRELAKWQNEYSTIHSKEDAIRTAEMLGYVQSYYVVGDGYRSDPETEAALEKQRQQAVDAFAGALQQYTNMDHGTDSQLWLAALTATSDGRERE